MPDTRTKRLPVGHRHATPPQHTDHVTERHPYLDGPYPRAFAHRGWHLGELAGMENSLAAFRRAVDEGYAYLEADVHATADGVVVVHHDETLERTTDAAGPVAGQPWSIVRRARVAGNEPICRFDELLEELPTAKINVDVKADPAVGPVLDVLRGMNAWDRVCLASFSEERLNRLRREGGDRLLTGIGSRSAVALRMRAWAPWLLARPPVRGAVAQLPRQHGRMRVVDAGLVRYAHQRGIEVHVWTIDSSSEMSELLDLGVDGLMTDRPDVLRDVLRARGAWPA
jgi:glycerophosphoryl diester phosphodiesterase